MATVRFSKELQEAIVKNARAVFDKQVKAADESRPSHEWGDRIYDTLFGEHVAALNAVPQYFLKNVPKVTVENVCGIRCNLAFMFTTLRPFPNAFPETDLAKPSGYYNEYIELKTHPAWQDLAKEVVDWKARCAEVEDKRAQFIDQVKKIIEAHATLAPALKVWPPLWDLIPTEYKDKHREIVKREKKEVVIEGVDLGALTSAVVANKLS